MNDFLETEGTLIHQNNRLQWSFESEQRGVSWAIHGGGVRSIREVLWLQVQNAELSEEVCPKDYIKDRLNSDGNESLVFLTSASIQDYRRVSKRRENIQATALVTLGLGNAMRVGDPTGDFSEGRTINLVCQVSNSLGINASLEALSIMTEARVAALFDSGIRSLQSGLPATGTGTDCQAILSSPIGAAEDYAGKHTTVGSLIGEVCYQAVQEAVELWLQRQLLKTSGTSRSLRR